jgi:hypothetical protein
VNRLLFALAAGAALVLRGLTGRAYLDGYEAGVKSAQTLVDSTARLVRDQRHR